MKLQREHDYYTNKLLDRQKKFQGELDIVAKQLRDFAGKDRMSEAENYMRELTEITEKLEQFQEEVSQSDISEGIMKPNIVIYLQL